MRLFRKIVDFIPIKTSEEEFGKFEYGDGTMRLWQNLLTKIKTEQMPPSEEKFWKFCLSFQNAIKIAGNSDLVIFFLKNKKRFQKEFMEGRITQEVLDEYLTYEMVNDISLQVLVGRADSGEITSDTWRMLKEIINRGAFREFPPISLIRVLRTIEEQEESLGKYFMEGRGTSLLLEKIVGIPLTSIEKEEIFSFLLSPYFEFEDFHLPSFLRQRLKEKIFWDSPLGELLTKNSNKLKEYFWGGEVHPIVVEEYLKLLEEKLQKGEMGDSLIIYSFERLKDLVGEVPLEKISNESLNFWRYLIGFEEGRSMYFLLRNRDLLTPDSFIPEDEDKIKFKTAKALIERLKKEPPEVIIATLRKLLLTTDLSEISLTEKSYYEFLANASSDLKIFLLEKEEALAQYISGGYFDKDGILSAFVDEVKIRPELLRTYESLAGVFIDLTREAPSSENRGLIYLKIAEALQVIKIEQRIEVETIDSLIRTLGALYWFWPKMTPFERQCWRILQKELPFTADISIREAMRNQALVVENLDPQKLQWVHQVVHNYASVKVPDYLRAFRMWLKTGNNEDLKHIREFFGVDSRCPDYSEEDRETLLKVIPELERLIELTSRFYEIKPERLETAIENVRLILPRFQGLKDILNSILESVKIISEDKDSEEKIFQEEQNFCLKVNSAREIILKAVYEKNIENEIKVSLVVLDSVLEGLSQQIFTRYTDYLRERNSKMSFFELSKGISILYEMFQAGFLNGENLGLEEEVRFFERFRSPERITYIDVHKARLLIPIIRYKMNSYWGRFISIAQPEMVAMLKRMGIPENEVLKQVYLTDLVNFRKKSMSFVIEPFVDLVSNILESMEKEVEGYKRNVEDLYKWFLGGKVVEIEAGVPQNEKVSKFLEGLLNERIPGDVVGATNFLREFSDSSFVRAEKLCRVIFPDFLDRESFKRRYKKIASGGQTIELFPFTFYGIDGVVILLNDEIVQNPEEFLRKRFEIVPAIERSLREGD